MTGRRAVACVGAAAMLLVGCGSGDGDGSREEMEPSVFADTVFTARDFDTNLISYCNGADTEIGAKRM